jgi:hypothetical protein
MFGKHPVHIQSQRDIQAAPAETDEIFIPRLPLRDYPLLSKFHRVRHIIFYTADGTGGTDEKLRALTALNLTNLLDIGLLNCPQVTDKGIEALARIKTLKALQLEGTSISDKACEILATNITLKGVNVANCANVTKNGILKLAGSRTLTELSLSADKLTQKDVHEVINSSKGIKWCDIVDPAEKLDTTAIAAKAAEKGIKMFVHPTGALQDMKMTDKELMERALRGGKLR